METEVERVGELIVTEEAPEDEKAVVPNLSVDEEDTAKQQPEALATNDSHHIGCNMEPPETAVITNGDFDSSDPESPAAEMSEHTCCPSVPEEKSEEEKSEMPTVFKRDPSVMKLMDSYAGKAKEMKEAIMETLNSRLGNENSPAGAAASSLEEEAARRLSLLKQVIQKNAIDAAQSSKPPEQTTTPPSCSSPVPRKDPSASRKSPSPISERVRCEKSPSPAAAPSKCCTPPECVATRCEKTTPEPAATSDNASQARTSCCGMRRSPLRKTGAQEANCAAAAAKRKGERAVENVLKILEPHETAEEKLGALFQHYLGFQEGTWQLQANAQKYERQVRQLSREKEQLSREKEQLQSECNRALLAKSKLESLCRELQKQCRTVKDECLMRIRDEEEKRREVASKFQTTLLDITAVLEENQSRSLQLKEENTQLAQRLKALIDHYDVWEKNVDNVLQQKELQVQVTAAHLARSQAQLQQERQAFMTEKQMVLKQVSDSERKTAELVARESHLRQELSSHATKYEEFQGALTQSNQLFRSFKLDMEKMSKKIKKLEKETVQWKSRWEVSNKALTEITSEKQSRERDLEAAQQRVSKLEKLCRALQLERNELSHKVKELGPTATIEETEATTTTANELAEG